MIFLIKGLIIGFAIAAPVGPIGVLCIRRTLADGRFVGFFSGFGAASADMFYGALAAFGLTAIQRILVGQQFWLNEVEGGLVSHYRILDGNPSDEKQWKPSLKAHIATFQQPLVQANADPRPVFGTQREARSGSGCSARHHTETRQSLQSTPET